MPTAILSTSINGRQPVILNNNVIFNPNYWFVVGFFNCIITLENIPSLKITTLNCALDVNP